MLKQILIYHARRYPEMEPTDGVKLIYQNEFGPGHLIANRDNARNRLINEVKSASAPLLSFEDIGNGLIRVFLTPDTDIEALLDAFCKSAAEVKGSVEAFEEKLDILRAVASEGYFRFTPSQLDDYLAEYKKAGYPPVSHSQTYRDNYKPSYRVVLRRIYNE